MHNPKLNTLVICTIYEVAGCPPEWPGSFSDNVALQRTYASG